MQSTTVNVLHAATDEHETALESAAYDVQHATDAASALDVLDAVDVDVVVHDATRDAWQLDVLDAVANATDAPVIARTPDPDGEFASAASAHGATAYCTHDDDLAARIADHLDRRPTADQAWYRRLHDAVSEPADDFETVVERLLDVGCERLDLPYGFLTRFAGDQQHVTTGIGNHPDLQTDAVAPLPESYCQYTAATDDGFLPLADAEAELPDSAPHNRFGLGCYVGGTVELDGERYGSLCFAGDTARTDSFDDADRTFVEFTVELCEHELERRRHRNDLEATRERYERLVERIDDAFFALDDDWTFTYVNQRAGALLDADPDALVGELVWDLYDDADAARFREHYERAMTEQTPVVFEEYYGPLDVWLEVSAYPAPDGVSVFFRDVSDRKHREQQLTDLLDTMRNLFAETDPDAIANAVVDATQDILGYDYVAFRLHDPETDTLPVAASTDELDADLPDRPTYDVGEGGPGRTFERGEVLERDVEGDDAIGPLTAARYYPIGDHGVLTVASRFDERPVTETERRLTEILVTNATVAFTDAERKQVLERYETVLENVQDMVFVLDDAGRFVFLSSPLAAAVDVPRKLLEGTHLGAILDAGTDTVDAALADSRADADGETTLETVLQAPRPFPVRVDVTALPADDEDATVGVVHDISDLTETRARLETENARFRQLFESLPDPVVENRFVDGEPLVERVNPAFEDVFGYDERELAGECINDFIVPEDRSEEAGRLDASTLDVEPGDATVVSSEIVRQTSQGTRHFLFRGISYLDGDVHRGYGIYTDITPQHERERRLQVLNTILRHNLRTEMTLVSGYVDQLAANSDAEEYADRIRDAVDEVVALSDKARELERALEGTPDPRLVDVVSHVRNAIADATSGRADREVAFDAEPATVIADYRLEIVVKNLVENAFEHGGGDVAVSVATTDTTVEIRVGDGGPGIPEFERELVTGDRDITQLEHGSGLGLWIATWLLDAFDGDLRFEDDASTVVAVVPRAHGDAHPAVAAERDGSANATED
ncbi:PAS domain S-box protein [Halorubellus sp. PRR65]|uniref:PAS domain S-box protein n=2 Tax=Halobacteriales TaxID=2235 RepID=UPI002B257E7A|nr:PAS domain S-box protein [Halorubellus sp. PRR65]